MEVFTCTGCNDGRALPCHPLAQAGRQPGGMLVPGLNFPMSDESRPHQPLPSDIAKKNIVPEGDKVVLIKNIFGGVGGWAGWEGICTSAQGLCVKRKLN